MTVHINNPWLWFCLAFGLMLFATILMVIQGNYFYTRDGSVRKFSIMELEFPATALEIVNIIKGMYDLPKEQSRKAINALRTQFLLDFILFMPATYGGIFILCMRVSEKMSAIGRTGFLLLAWLQIIAFLFDTIENIYLLRKIKPDVTISDPTTHKWYITMEIAKWGIALVAAIGSFSALMYYWLSGSYDDNSIKFVAIFAVEVFLFFPLTVALTRKFGKQKS